MKNKPFYSILLAIMLILGSAIPSVAQPAGEIWITQGFAHFVIAVIAGVLLAFAFQYLLTNLGVAMGITAIGDVREKGMNTQSTAPRSNSTSSSNNNSSPGSMGKKVSSAFGVYLTVSMAIALFFASLIAVKLSLIADNTIGFTLGLVIWAGYLLLALIVDSKIISSLTGSIFSSVKEVLRAGTSAVGSAFSSSKKSEVEKMARKTVEGLHEEVRQEFDTKKIKKKLKKYANELEPKNKMDNVEKHLAALIKQLKVREEYDLEDSETVKQLFFEETDAHSITSKKNKKKMKKAFEKAKEIEKNDGSKAHKAMAAIDELAPDGEARKYRKKVEQYLRETDEEELQPDKLKEDLNKILNNPKAGPDVVKERIGKIDRSTLKSLLTNKEGIDDQKAEKYLNKGQEVLNKIESKASKSSSGNKASDKKTKKSAKQSIKHWLDRMNESELKYNNLKHEAKQIMDDPKTAPSVLKNQLKQMDHESMVALMSNNKKLSTQQAEKMVGKIEQGRDEIIQKMDKIEMKVKEKTMQAKQMALREAEAARKTAAAAAWWIFIATVLSGGASALGGILALTL